MTRRKRLSLSGLKGVQGPAIIIVLLFAIVIFFIYAGTSLGLDESLSTNLIAVMPSMISIAIGGSLLLATAPILSIIGMAGIGIGFALFISESISVGMFPTPSGSLTIPMIQSIIIVLAFLVGVVMWISKR